MIKILFSITLLLFICVNSIAQVAVIAHKSAPVDEISRSQVLDFYTRDVRTWENGQAVIVFDLKPKSAVKNSFYNFIGKTSSRMKSIWMKNLLSGEGDPPKAFVSEQEMLENVANTPGAIGFISEDMAGSEVKVVAIIELVKDD